MKVVNVVMIYLAAGFCFFLAGRDFGSEQGPTQWGFFASCVGGVLVLFPRLTRGKTPWVEFDTALEEARHHPAESPSSSSSSSSSAVVRKYPYLPEQYDQPYATTLAEWHILRFTAAYNGEGYLTDKISRDSLVAAAHLTHVDILVGTHPQPAWNVYREKGQFNCPQREVRAAYDDAARALMQSVRTYFPGISDQRVRIEFFIRGAAIGIWQGGKMTLEGEE